MIPDPYIKVLNLIERLKQEGHEEYANRLYHAYRNGCMASEILSNIGLELDNIHRGDVSDGAFLDIIEILSIIHVVLHLGRE